MDVTAVEDRTFVVHTERITISGDRYLIYYTFTLPSDEAHDNAASDAQRPEHV